MKTLFKHNGVIKEFGSGEDIVNEIADEFALSEKQKTTKLERIYKKENRIVKTPVWHRLLFRAADSLAKDKYVSRPSDTKILTQKKEWMLTENGYDEVLRLLKIPTKKKEELPTKSFEVQKIVNKLLRYQRPEKYNPIDKDKILNKVTKEIALRKRGFRQAVVEAYDYKCAVCGLKIKSPDLSIWEVEAAHIVPHSSNGKDDVINGLALCHLHHWAFDVGWLAIQDDFTLLISSKTNLLPKGYGKIFDYDFLKIALNKRYKIFLPNEKEIYPHQNAISWHRENKFYN